ncbi:hypothetical protein [Dactylosporangium sp. NPDC051541]|uniref:hypothetical protein n=1 Tax=Dactylosporangium sp. NPDC051541 TaxID=3363977 RepID=UPI0037A247A5
MTTRLSGGVIPAASERVAPPGADRPGTPVVVGPAGTAPDRALERLAALVARGGVVAADAGVDLGDGFRSARVDGGAGTRRDGVLAALHAVGAEPLGTPAAVSVALFGIEATKPLGAAATAAVTAGRWAALRFAVAAAAVLGPEQLVTLLGGTETPAGFDPFPDGLASVVGEHLRQVLGPLPRPRRLDLLLDLWAGVCAHERERRHRARRRDTQAPDADLDALRVRYQRYTDDDIVAAVRHDFHREPTVADAARWTVPAWYRDHCANAVLWDCLAATVLVRLAISVADHGTPAALHRHRAEINAAAKLLHKPQAELASRAIEGLADRPARPGVLLRRLQRRTDDAFVRATIADARLYGELAVENARGLLYRLQDEPSGPERTAHLRWVKGPMAAWRDAVGLFSPERPARWHQPPLLGPADGHPLGWLIERGEPAPEHVGDLLWLAELGDALAQLDGHPAADIHYGPVMVVDWEPDGPDPSPLDPRWDSVALAAGGTAQLAGLAGLQAGTAVAAAARRARTWTGLIAALQAAAATAEALTATFVVPEAILATDGTALPGGDERIEIARTARRIAEWGSYMGNCIGGAGYVEDALAGRSVLVAVHAQDRILVNAELRPRARGWRVEELRARFNQDPEPDLADRFRAWVATLPPPPVAVPAAAPPPLPRPRRGRVRTPAARVAADHGPSLGARAAEALAGVAEPLSLLARLAPLLTEAERYDHVGSRIYPTAEAFQARDRPPGRIPLEPGPAGDDLAALTALRRATPGALLRALGAALEAGGGGLTAAQAWRAGGARPLSLALDGYDAADLEPLTVDAPLPGSLRTVAKAPGISEARTAELVAQRVRRALGGLLRAGAPGLVGRRPYGIEVPMLCACALAVTTWSGPGVAVLEPRKVHVGGYPASALNDETGPWGAAWPDAVELGADRDAFWYRIVAHGLLVPAAWLEPAGWSALWAHANRRRG